MPDLNMAYRKLCDECGAELGMDGTPFLQIFGSISEQIEYPDGKVLYKYLTAHARSKSAWCNNKCQCAWLDRQREAREFIERPLYPQG